LLQHLIQLHRSNFTNNTNWTDSSSLPLLDREEAVAVTTAFTQSEQSTRCPDNKYIDPKVQHYNSGWYKHCWLNIYCSSLLTSRCTLQRKQIPKLNSWWGW
jgi:hypothetical protein